MIDLDGTENKGRLGANALLADLDGRMHMPRRAKLEAVAVPVCSGGRRHEDDAGADDEHHQRRRARR